MSVSSTPNHLASVAAKPFRICRKRLESREVQGSAAWVEGISGTRGNSPEDQRVHNIGARHRSGGVQQTESMEKACVRFTKVLLLWGSTNFSLYDAHGQPMPDSWGKDKTTLERLIATGNFDDDN